MSAESDFAFMAITNKPNLRKQSPNRWKSDTAANMHMTPFNHLLENPQSDHTKVLSVGGNYVDAQLTGHVMIKQGKKYTHPLPSTPQNLLSGIIIKKSGIFLMLELPLK
jgi:hypothetical protein